MHIVIAIDSFKGSLTSLEAGEAIKCGILRALPDTKVTVRPLADGGEGTVEALTIGMGGTLQNIQVAGPLGKPTIATYGILSDTKTAIMEMSQAAGITLLSENERNPLETTTYGVGEMIVDAIRQGCRQFIMGIGGSATNDGGTGMLQALGFDLLDAENTPIPYGAKGLAKLDHIGDAHVIPELYECTFKIACDVTNPLCGTSGASAIFGPQKGATPAMIMDMDKWLAYFAHLTREKFPKANPNHPGTGAAGGLGFAFLSYTNAVLESGIQIVLDETKLIDYVKEADLVITGEGRLDGQTIFGKAPIGVAKIAKIFNKKVLAFCGSATPDAIACNAHGIDAFFPILRQICTLSEAMQKENAMQNLTATTEQVIRAMYVGN